MPTTSPEQSKFKGYLHLLLRFALPALVAGAYLLLAQSQGQGTQSIFSEIKSALVPDEQYRFDPATPPVPPTANPTVELPVAIATYIGEIELSSTPTETATQSPTATPTASPTEIPIETPEQSATETPTATPTETPSLQPTFTPKDAPLPTYTPTIEPPKATPGDTPTALPAVAPSPTISTKSLFSWRLCVVAVSRPLDGPPSCFYNRNTSHAYPHAEPSPSMLT